MLIQNWIQQIIIDADLMKIRSGSNHGPNQLWFDLSTVQPKRQIIAGKPCIFVTNLLSGFLLPKVLFSSRPKTRIIAGRHFPCIPGLPCQPASNIRGLSKTCKLINIESNEMIHVNIICGWSPWPPKTMWPMKKLIATAKLSKSCGVSLLRITPWSIYIALVLIRMQ